MFLKKMAKILKLSTFLNDDEIKPHSIESERCGIYNKGIIL